MEVRTGSILLSWAQAGIGERVRTQKMSGSPSKIAKTARRGAEHNLKAAFIRWSLREFPRLREDQSQVLEDSIDIALFRYPDIELLRTETDAGTHLPQAPGQKSAAFDSALEPVF